MVMLRDVASIYVNDTDTFLCHRIILTILEARRTSL